MAYLFIGLVAFAVSGLTLFSGFGLGTLLLPAFSLLFPVEVAVAATAVVHGLNNLFKVGLLYRHAVGRVLVRFGIPAVAAAFAGAALLTRLSGQEPLATWSLGARTAEVTPIRAIDGRQVGSGKPGPVTRKAQDMFAAAVAGKLEDYRHWLEFV